MAFLALLAAPPLPAQVAPAPVPPAARLAPALREPGRGAVGGAVRVQVQGSEAAFGAWVRAALPGARLRPVAPGVVEVSGLRPGQLAQLAAAPAVGFVDVAARPAHDERLLNGADLTVNALRATQRRYPALTGQGLAVSIKENPLDYADLDLRGRLLNTPPDAVTESAHATIMATLVAGAGNSGPAGEGAAPRAGVASSSYANLLPDANASLTALGVSVQNHSYGTGLENYYGLEARGYDQQARELPTLLHVFSSGNSGTATPADGPYRGLTSWATLTGQFKQSKNSLAVGATDALGAVAAASSRGPAYDGRVKPELVAYGDAGSSDAAALVSGAALLVQQAWRDGAGAGTLPSAALVKAALLTGADDVGRPAVDYASGFGQLNALAAVRAVLEGRTRAGSVAQGQEQTFAITVPAGTAQLKVTLAWADPEAAAGAAAALVNDLDLEVLAPDGARLLPWTLSAYPHPDSLVAPARRRPDHRNNAEQVTLAAPAPGTYQVRVRGYALAGAAPQAFSLAYAAEAAGFEWLTPDRTRNVRPGQPARLRWHWAGPAATGRLDYRPVGSRSWRPLTAGLDLAAGTWLWAAPDTTTRAQLRCVVGGQEIVSDTFALVRPLPMRVGYVCADESLLSWPATPGARAYQVYTLGPVAPEPYRLVADTLLTLDATQSARRYFAVAPVLDGRPAERGATASLPDAGVGCYVRSFLPLTAVADTVRLRLQLGTLYRLREVQLQRLDAGAYRTIQTLRPPTQTDIVFTDLTAQPGPNQYRVLGVTDAGRSFTTDAAEVQLVRAGEALVYPVPARVGEPLQVAGPPGRALHLRLHDALGRRVREADGSGGLFSELPTDGLTPGLYLLQVEVAGSPALTRRVVLW